MIVNVAFKWEPIWLIPEEKYVLGVDEAIRVQSCSTKPVGTDIQIPIEHKPSPDHE